MTLLKTLASQVTLLYLIFQLSHVYAQDSSPTGPTFKHTDPYCNAWHKVAAGDGCLSIQHDFNITSKEFLRWNPDVSADCTTNFWGGYSYCVGVSADTVPGGPTFPNTVSNCLRWHRIVSGDSCATLQKDFDITLDDFLTWNPDVSKDCTSNFWLGNAYCVAAGDESSTTSIQSTTSIESTSSRIPTISTPYSIRHPVTSFNLSRPSTVSTWPPEKTFAGQIDHCNRWHQVGAGQTCQNVLNLYGNTLSEEQLFEYNPSLGKDCSGLFYGWFICIGIQPRSSSKLTWFTGNGNASIPSPTEFTPPVVTVVPDFTPVPQNPGIPESCQNFYQAQDGDTCNQVLDIYNYVSKKQFFDWNPSLKGNCGGLWSGYYYCVANFDDNDLPLPPTVTESPSSTAPGAVKSCKLWYQAVGDDDCAAISLAFGTFSKTDFISWNPSVKQDCSGIKEGLWYCVAVPGTPTTRTTVPTPTDRGSLPTQSGLVDGCTQYWLVSPDDTCESIISQASISDDDFYSWNPAIGGPSCSNLKTDYYVCIGTSPVVSVTGGSTTTYTPGATPTEITSTKAPPTTTSDGGGSIQTPSPVMPGMVDGCVRFWYRGDDSANLFCYDIASQAGISLSDFYKWNPGVGDNCGSLWADTWYCLGVTGKPTTISTGGPKPT